MIKLRDGKNINNSVPKVALKFDITMLNNIIGYIYKNTSMIGRRELHNVKKLFDSIDDSIYEPKPNLYARFRFIQRTLHGRLDKGYENESILINFCREEVDNKDVNAIINNLEKYKKINFEEIQFISKAVSDRLKYLYLLQMKDKMYSTIEKLDSGDYESYEEINDSLADICTQVITQNRKLKTLNTNTSFSLSDENFEDTIDDIATKLKNPSGMIFTGIRMLNQILAPAYLSKRVYCYMGLPAGFKSGILLKTVLDAKKYNRKRLLSSKPGKRPAILLVTMENTVEETVERIFNMTVYADDIRNYDNKEIIRLLKEKGQMTLESDDDIDIIIEYHSNRSIDTSDLYTIIEELSEDNRDVRMLVLDYIKRIRPTERAKDEKEELKHITNELHSLAVDYDIPVVTAHQLNRAAAATVDAALSNNQHDVTKQVGRSNVGSAWEIMENIDWGCIISLEQKQETGQYYLTFKRIKIRYRDPNDLGYFNHPFNSNNRMQLLDDLELPESLSEVSLASTFVGVADTTKGKKHAAKRKIDDDDGDDLFNFGKKM